MSVNKTQPTAQDVSAFIAGLTDERRRDDSTALLSIMHEASGHEPRMWGASIVGFGDYHYRSERSGREGDWFITGFSPRKQAMTLYSAAAFKDHPDLLNALGKHSMGQGCLYIRRLADVDQHVLKELVIRVVAAAALR